MSQGNGWMLRRRILATAIAGVILGGTVSQAANVWDGGASPNNNWSAANNWDNNTVPTFPAPVTFGGLIGLTPINDINTNPLVRGITFDVTAGSFNLSGSAITLNATTVAGTTTLGVTDNTVKENNGGIKLSSLAASTVALPMSLAAGRHVFTTDLLAGTLSITGAVTRQAGSNANFIVNGGAINAGPVSQLTNDATGILGGWATVGTDPTLSGFASRDGSGNIVPYTYAPANVFASDAFPAGTTLASNLNYTGGGTTLTIPAGAQANTLLFSEQTTTVNTMTVTDTLTFANGGGIFRSADVVAQHVLTGGTMTAGTSGPATLYLRQNSAAPDPGVGPPEAFNVLTRITDNAGGGAVTVVKSGFGVTRWSPPAPGNTFTGGLYVNEGQLRPTTVGALGAATSPVYVADGAQVLVNIVTKIDNPWFIKGHGPQEQGGVLNGEFRGGAIRLNNAGIELAGTITLQADASIGARGGQTASTATNAQFISGRITGPHNLRLNMQNTQGAAGITASMPTIRLTNSGNDWTGNTQIGRGRLTIGTAGAGGEVIPHGPGFGNVEMVGEALSESILNLNGNTETVNGLTSSGDESLIVITNHDQVNLGTIGVGANNQTSTFGGRIVDDGAGKVKLSKVGSGAFTLTNANSAWTGDTHVGGGTLTIPSFVSGTGLADAAAVLIANGAALNLPAGTDLVTNLYLGGSPATTGTWGRTGHPTALHKTGLITGDGVLDVQAIGLLYGDYDGNNVVDARDFVLWRNSVGTTSAWANDRFTGTTVDSRQYTQWAEAFGATIGPVVAAALVPEPATMGLFVVAGLFGLSARRRCRRQA